VITYYVRGGQLLNVVAVQESNSWGEESWIVPDRRDELIAAYADTHHDLRLVLDCVEHCSVWGLFDRDPLPVWSTDRITLLGDAAHPMLPFLGQGAAMAIEDAYILARALSYHPEDIPVALRSYDAARVPRATQVQLASRRQATIFHQSPSASMEVGVSADWIYQYDPTRPSIISTQTSKRRTL
jgi:salicylate hydroxylase